ncbi:ATP-NAD kinase-like domain-containing protein [Dipodascopsis tothii]|uniref:ATP-NAD kinase-like domain-containing protein n=1 Tax=Dipodascopsis tothii TaxID=44089 RepID=UPI0034CE27CE
MASFVPTPGGHAIASWAFRSLRRCDRARPPLRINLTMPSEPTETDTAVTDDRVGPMGTADVGTAVAATPDDVLFVRSADAAFQVVTLSANGERVQVRDGVETAPAGARVLSGPPAIGGGPVTVVCSTKSGQGRASTVYRDAVGPLLRALDVAHTVVETTSAEHVAEIARGLGTGPQTLVVLSGDTSVHELINNVEAGDTLRLCVIPTGSGNALLTSLGATVRSAVAALVFGTVRPLSAFSVVLPPGTREAQPETETTPYRVLPPVAEPVQVYALVVASWAIHAALVGDSDTPEYRKLGNARFAKAAQENLARNEPWRGSIAYTPVGGGPAETVPGTEHSYVLLTGISSLEPGFVVAPDAVPLSGRFWFVHMGFLPGDEIMEVLMKAYKGGEHVHDPRTFYKEVDGLEVTVAAGEPDRMRRWCVDGRIFVSGEGAPVRVLKGGPTVRGRPVELLA